MSVRAEDVKLSSQQLHLRLSPHHAQALRQLAAERDQTLSGAVRFLLAHYSDSLRRDHLPKD